ncbi:MULTISPECIES: MgtC/SapB family protein [Alphaproteobacteria]|uniref:Membrane protein n=2 Tax=Alphaproteobacteria TaxID=28211 RepID=A0A512HKX4_9HYPH|nr:MULTISPECIES: DUF4010 domain-containing protein [Alphaproteobacteria]GEO86104.1 membrane protein [Ciceribacter naphthalenivorans]GLR22191.1 membrane protein [Ciceribacter naphthalenivorans]GLT05047.1 membrane protein [Sphingomonas psychrolutea]
MDNVELFERLGLAIAIGAAVGVERHWRERDEPEGGRTAGIRTFTLFGMAGGVAGLLERSFGVASSYSGITLTGFLIAIALVMAIFEMREAIAEKTYSVTSVVAAILTFGLGALAALGDMALASAGGAALVTILASREFLHQAIRRLTWVELRSAVILLAMTFVLRPILPDTPVGPFGGVSPKSIVMLAIMLASISFAGYVAVRMFGSTRGDVLAGAIGGLVSSTGTTVAFARRSASGEDGTTLSAGAISASAVSLLRTALLVATLAQTLLPVLLWPLVAGAAVLALYALILARSHQSTGGEVAPGNPFELAAVAKMALLLTCVAFLARAATQQFGGAGLIFASALSALADVDAATVTVASLLPSLQPGVAAQAVGVAALTNMAAKAVYGSVFGCARFSWHLWGATALSAAAALGAWALGSVV